MGVSVTHEPPNPPENQPSPASPPSSSSPPSIPPTATPPVTPIDPDYVRLLEGTLANQNRKIADMERTRATGDAAPPPVAKPSKEERRQAFYDDPDEATRKVIREELQATIGPINEVAKMFRGTTVIDEYIARYRLDPRFKGNWDENVERYVREQASSVDPSNLNDNSFGFIVVSAIGLKASGMFTDHRSAAPTPTPTPTPTPSTTPESRVETPPYLRPSGPPGPAPVDPNAPVHRQLTEEEKRLLREYNASKPAEKKMTEAQYIKWQDMPGESVAFTMFDRPTPAK